MNFEPKNKACQIVLRSPSSADRLPAKYHTIVQLILQPTGEALTLDATSMQYGHTVKTHRHSDYTSSYEERKEEPSREFGYTYGEMLNSVARGVGGSIALNLAACILDDAVQKEAGDLGGRNSLYEMSHDDFVCARDKIGRAVCIMLTRLCLGLD